MLQQVVGDRSVHTNRLPKLRSGDLIRCRLERLNFQEDAQFFRTRSSSVVLAKGQSHVVPCLVALLKTVHSTMEQDCVMSERVEWHNCAARCDVDRQQWQSQVRVLPSPHGENCPSSSVEAKSCVKAPVV